MFYNPLDLKDKKILITGGTGFFGRNLCEYLNQLNIIHDLRITIYSMARNDIGQAGVKFVSQDITKEIIFANAVDYIIHAATPVVNATSNNDELLDIIINGTQKISNLALRLNCKKLLLISSGAVYGTQPSILEKISEDYFSETLIYEARNAYGTGKRISEIVVKSILDKSNTEISIVRGFAFSGKYLAYDQHFAIGNFVRDAVTTKLIKIKGNGCAIRSYMDSSDLCHWVISILLNGKNNEAYNLGSDQEISIKDLAFKVASFVEGARVEIENRDQYNLKTNRYVPSISKAKKELNLAVTVTIDESIQKMINFYEK